MYSLQWLLTILSPQHTPFDLCHSMFYYMYFLFYVLTTCIVAPFVYFWYPFLVRMIPGRGMHRVLGRVCLDQVCFMSSLLTSLRSYHALHITFLSWHTRHISFLSWHTRHISFLLSLTFLPFSYHGYRHIEQTLLTHPTNPPY